MKSLIIIILLAVTGLSAFDASAYTSPRPDCYAGPYYYGSSGAAQADAQWCNRYSNYSAISHDVQSMMWSTFTHKTHKQYVYFRYSVPPCFAAGTCYLSTVTGQYLNGPPPAVCELPWIRNAATNTCELCATGAWDSLSGSCIAVADSCGGMATLNTLNNQVTSCEVLPQGSCSSSIGSLSYDPTFDFCQAYADSCATQGGTYGAVGSGTTNTHVCITASPPMPQCSAVSVYDDGSGQYGAACTSQIVPNSVCDATLYNCDGDPTGSIDDQDGDGCVDNGVSNGTCSGTTTGQAPAGEPAQNVGYSVFESSKQGAGQCDPTSRNYAQCIGTAGNGGATAEEIASSLTQNATGGEASQIKASGDAQANSDNSAYETAVIGSFGDGISPVTGDADLLNTVKGLFVIDACQDLTFQFKGEQWGITCASAQPIRTALGWLIAVLTLLYVANLAIQPVGSKV